MSSGHKQAGKRQGCKRGGISNKRRGVNRGKRGVPPAPEARYQPTRDEQVKIKRIFRPNGELRYNIARERAVEVIIELGARKSPFTCFMDLAIRLCLDAVGSEWQWGARKVAVNPFLVSIPF